MELAREGSYQREKRGGRASQRANRAPTSERGNKKQGCALPSRRFFLTSPSPPRDSGTSSPNADHRSKAVLFLWFHCKWFLRSRRFERASEQRNERDASPRVELSNSSEFVGAFFLLRLRILASLRRLFNSTSPLSPDVGECERSVRRSKGHDRRGRGQEAGEVREERSGASFVRGIVRRRRRRFRAQRCWSCRSRSSSPSSRVGAPVALHWRP